MSIHVVSDKSLQRPDYIYSEDGIGYPADAKPEINWNNIDGPILYCRNGSIHWLSWLDRLRLWLGYDDIDSLERKYQY